MYECINFNDSVHMEENETMPESPNLSLTTKLETLPPETLFLTLLQVVGSFPPCFSQTLTLRQFFLAKDPLYIS